MRFLSGLLTGVLVSSGFAMSAQAPAPPVYGQGTNSCGMWQEGRQVWAARKDTGDGALGVAAARQSWVLGFVTGLGVGIGASSEKLIPRSDPQGIWAAVDKACQEEPTKLLYVAAGEVLFNMKRP